MTVIGLGFLFLSVILFMMYARVHDKFYRDFNDICPVDPSVSGKVNEALENMSPEVLNNLKLGINLEQLLRSKDCKSKPRPRNQGQTVKAGVSKPESQGQRIETKE